MWTCNFIYVRKKNNVFAAANFYGSYEFSKAFCDKFEANKKMWDVWVKICVHP